MRNREFVQPATIDAWALVSFDTSHDAAAKANGFARDLCMNLQKLGVSILIILYSRSANGGPAEGIGNFTVFKTQTWVR